MAKVAVHCARTDSAEKCCATLTLSYVSRKTLLVTNAYCTPSKAMLIIGVVELPPSAHNMKRLLSAGAVNKLKTQD